MRPIENMDNDGAAKYVDVSTIHNEHGQMKYLDVSTINKELEESSSRAEEIVEKIKRLNEETARLKENLLILTGAKLAFKKIIDASQKRDVAKATAAS